MRGPLFVDTGMWIALRVAHDAHHGAASEALRRAHQRGLSLVTTNHVVGESYTFFRRNVGHEAAFRFIDALAGSSRLEIVHVDADLERRAFELLRKFRDHRFSFVDGTSFAVMQKRRIKHALAFDADFAAAGFIRVPLDEPMD